jgi:hypothetical protein
LEGGAPSAPGASNTPHAMPFNTTFKQSVVALRMYFAR